MTALFVGGSASGKSERAEELCVALHDKNPGSSLVYIATLDKNSGGDTAERILRHRERRRGTHFATAELSVSSGAFSFAGGFSIPRGATCLFEDVGNFVARSVFSPVPIGIAQMESFLDGLVCSCENVVFVTNDIFLEDTSSFDGEMMRYFQALSKINAALSKKCGRVVQVVSGIGIELKIE